MSVVDGPVTFVGYNQIEVGMPEPVRPKLAGNSVKGSNDDLPFQAAFSAIQNDSGPVAEIVIQGFFSLFGKFNPIYQKQYAGNDSGLKPAFHQHGYGKGLACTGGHFK